MLTFAFLLDLFFGDPVYAWHPVRLMGRAIESGEIFWRKVVRHEKIAGAILALALPVLVFGGMSWAVRGLEKIYFWAGFAAQVLGIYTAVSVRDLHTEGMRVYQSLKKQDLEGARKDVGRIVGRDTNTLSEEAIVCASVETIAESTMDGIVAPLFYAALGGAPLALAYKAVNTLDSMIGHRSNRYIHFGFAAAKQDELWNWIPARISYVVSAVAAIFAGGRKRAAWAVGWRYGAAAPYGNSAVPEATFAGALGLELGGRSTYQGRVVDHPVLGVPRKKADKEDIRESLKLMWVASWITLAVCLSIHGALNR